jgi:hypothetical protein
MKEDIGRSLFRLSLLIALVTIFSFEGRAQADSSFTPHGKPLALIFSDINYSFNQDGNAKAFELTRAYFGYEYFFSKHIYSRLTLDVADPGVGELQLTAVLKYAFVQYRGDKFSARFGMISTDMFTLSENHWGYRYIYKSFQDAYKFGPSADLGAAFEYSPAKIFSFDLSMLNGEGYKKVQIDSTFKATFGLTLRPFKGFILRGYADFMNNDFAQTSGSVFAAYTIEKFKAGMEYNFQKNNAMADGHDLLGISAYASLGLGEKHTVFIRYDNLRSGVPGNGTDPWNKSKDGQIIIAGFDYSPVKGVKIAPTYLGYIPYDKSLSFTSKAGLWVEIRF